MDDTQPLQPQGISPELLENDETGPLLDPDIYEYICLLYDGRLTTAIRNVLESPVVIENAPKQYVQYPSPAEAWFRDATYRIWASDVGSAMQRRSVESKSRFNILAYINAITDYDSTFQSYAMWYQRQWRRGNQYNSWAMRTIRKRRRDTYTDIKSIPNT